MIKNSTESSELLSARFGVSINTINKWESRVQLTDKSSAPIQIKYALSEFTKALIVGIRTSTWLPLDEIFDMVSTDQNPISRSSIYRLFVKEKINTVPQEKKDKVHKFKAYEPGYLHIDVTYLPKFNGLNSYLYVAIDRATRLMYYAVYQNKTAIFVPKTHSSRGEASVSPKDLSQIIDTRKLFFTFFAAYVNVS